MLRRGLSLAALALLLTQASACNSLARAALFTAVMTANLAVIVTHDAHFHEEGCGHHHRWRDGRVVYYYEGRWEYYDGDRGEWYQQVD